MRFDLLFALTISLCACATEPLEFEGRPYRSLSAVARHITGTRWNGWTFFGLRQRGGA